MILNIETHLKKSPHIFHCWDGKLRSAVSTTLARATWLPSNERQGLDSGPRRCFKHSSLYNHDCRRGHLAERLWGTSQRLHGSPGRMDKEGPSAQLPEESPEALGFPAIFPTYIQPWSQGWRERREWMTRRERLMSCIYCLGDPKATSQLHFHPSFCKPNYFHENCVFTLFSKIP